MDANQHRFAMFANIQDAQTLVVGGGPVALRKTQRLIDAGARVTIVALKCHDELIGLHANGQLHIKPKAFNKTDLNGMAIVVAATDDLNTNRQIAQVALANGIHVNVVNDPAAGNFIMPSVVERLPLRIAISSGGASPVLTRLLSSRIDAFIPKSFGSLASLTEKYRELVKAKVSGSRELRRFWEQQLGGRVGEMVLQGRTQQAQRALELAIEQYHATNASGEVYLVGAGPGDPDLLSFRALRLMQNVDVVFYDRLVSEAVLALVKPDAERIYVGKQRSNHAMQQAAINEQLIEHAKSGKRVLRLKGGDPFIFGRGGEEIEQLAEHGIAFQVVPGITAAAGCASYAGIPLTHRDYSQACLFITGHLKDNRVELNWPALVQPQQTVVIYMGLVGLSYIVEKLIEHGMASTMPIALISHGTTQQQRVISGTLDTIVNLVKISEVTAPTLTIIGDVVTLREKLKWFEPENSDIKLIGGH